MTRLVFFSTLLPVFLLSQFITAQAQGTRAVPTELEAVTVFLNKAQLTSTATATAEPGSTNIVLGGLPSNLDPQSLTVEATGDVILQGVLFQNNYLKTNAKPQTLAKLEDSLETTKAKLRIHTDQREILGKEENMIMANQAIGGTKGVDADNLEEMADFFRARLTKIRAQIMQEEKKIKALTQQLQNYSQQLQEFNNQPSKPTGEVVVSLSAQNRVPVTFTVSYMVENAGWTPLYDLRAKDTKGKMKLVYKAEVYQQTGLDWKKVKLTLSSALPAVAANKPALTPWRMSVQENNIRFSRSRIAYDREVSEGISSEEKAAGLVDTTLPAPTMANFTQNTESALAVEFAIGLPYTIASDGKPHAVELQQYDVAAKYQYYAVPKLDLSAYLVARIFGWDQYNLLPGNVNVYMAGTFIGTSFLDANSTTDTLLVSMGRDKNVVVSRERVKEFKAKSLFGNSINEQYGYLVTVRNSKTESISVLVEDQLPISAHGSISVEEKDLANGTLDKETGTITWTLKLKPNEAKKIRFQFEVKYPKGKRITGLNG